MKFIHDDIYTSSAHAPSFTNTTLILLSGIRHYLRQTAICLRSVLQVLLRFCSVTSPQTKCCPCQVSNF